MRETPGIVRLLWDLAQLPYFVCLTVLLRLLFPVMKRPVLWNIYRPWALKAHAERERIAFLVITDLKDISPESYRSAAWWFRR